MNQPNPQIVPPVSADKSDKDEAALLAALSSENPKERVAAALSLHAMKHPLALQACLRTLDDEPDPLHSDRTPAVQCLREIGAPALPELFERLEAENPATRLHAQRAVEGISRQSFGWNGTAWPSGAMERWLEWWQGMAFDYNASLESRKQALVRLRKWHP